MPNQSFDEAREIVRGAKAFLKRTQESGVTTLFLRKSSPPQGSKTSILEPVRQRALGCRACRLSQDRKKVVFGEGSLEASLVFVGEGPGREEDLQGRPFVGAAGELLTKMIQAMGLSRPEVYITNVVKCRPPQNRPPEPDEMLACRPFWMAQLRVIRPKVICALGRTAATALLESQAPLHQLREQTHHWQGIPVVVTFHPAYLLRNPAAKPTAWADLKKVLEQLKK